MSNKIAYTIDVEKDLHSDSYKSITLGLKRFEKLCDKYKIEPILFVTGECIEKYPKLFLKWHKKGWEISSHGLSHERFDEMTYKNKEVEIKEIIKIWDKYLKSRPKGFRAPQHSIDDETLDLLDKYGFEYDSSYHPLNLMQLLFFPKKINLWAKLFFSKLNSYKIRENLIEVPCSSLLIPFVSLIIRVFPLWLLKAYVSMIKLLYKNPVFYAHSWDFIELKESRIDKAFSHEKFITKLGEIMKYG